MSSCTREAPRQKRQDPGWASWRQLWPNKEDEKPAGVPEFDVSGIDTDNIPEPVCREALFELSGFLVPTCHAWEALPDLGVGALHLRDADRHGGTSFFHITSPIPTDQEELAALKQRLTESPYPEPGRNIEIIPVKYDFGQLWKWIKILEKFALSDANTTGITFVELITNYHFPDAANWLVPPLWVGGMRPIDYNEYEHRHALRNILMVAATDAYGTADALPHLLPLLGIPVDAVGLILWHDRRPIRLFAGKETAGISTGSQNTVNLDFTQNPGKVMDDITFVRSHWWLVSEGFSLSTANSDVQKLPATLYQRIADSLAYAA